MGNEELSISDATLIARLREDVFYGDERLHNLSRHNPLHMEAADRIEQLADELHTMKTGGIIEVANRNNRVTEYMFYWEGRALEAESKLEESEAKLGEYNLIWQAYDGDLHQAYVDANEARIDAEAKLSECEARLGKAVELLRKHCDTWAMNDFDAADLEALIGEKE